LRRILSVFLFFLFALPVGVSLSGCAKGSSAAYCSGSIGPRTGDVQNIVLQPQIGGISMGYAQTFNVAAPTGTDCKNNTVSLKSITYATSNGNVADINPTTGALCAGQWNRNSPGGVPNFTFCTSTGQSGISELTASSGGANSNKVLVYVHPQITSIALGSASTCKVNADGTLADPATNCFCGNQNGDGVTLTAPNCYSATAPPPTGTATLTPNSCLSFNQSALLVARIYAGDPSITANNITNIAGEATYTAQTASLFSFNNNTGLATALLPGSTVVTASIAQSTSTAGVISVCPPTNITITTPNTANGSVTVNPNNTEPITAVVTDANKNVLTGLTLTFTSTTPESAPATSVGISPIFPGVAAINAFCLPPACNPSPYGNVGVYANGTPNGNGKPIVSNTIVSTTPGSASTRLWIGSTDSLYITPVDLTTPTVPPPTKLPYQPNSMIINQAGTSIFMGSSVGLMTFTTASNSLTSTDFTVQGTALAVSPDNATVVITDPTRKLIYIDNTGTTGTTGTTTTATSPTVVSSFAGVGTRAAFTPDGSVAYITTTDNHLLVYSTFSGWNSYDLSATGANDVAIAVPSVGAFVTGNTAVNARSYCPNSNATPTVFYPQAGVATLAAAVGDRAATTNDGRHLLDVRLPTSGGTPILNDITFPTSTGDGTFNGVLPTGDCPQNGNPPTFGLAPSTVSFPTGVLTTGVTGVYPASDSSIAFSTYLPTAAATAGAILPAYVPAGNGVGTVSSVQLAGAATAPVFGVFSSDNKTFFTGTSGDNLVHLITRSTLTDTSQLAPKLPSVATPGGLATPNLIVQYPRTVTNN
jgi:hypothetical protein